MNVTRILLILVVLATVAFVSGCGSGNARALEEPGHNETIVRWVPTNTGFHRPVVIYEQRGAE